jgi:serine/threonine protein kinase
MPIASVAAFLRLIDEYGLVEPEQRPHLAKLAEDGPRDPRDFAREVMRRGWLTPYQINQLFQDNGASLLLGSYVVLERLGSGGMGNVFKARHQKLGRVVALKVIHRAKLDNRAAVKRFLREIRVAGQLDHPHIVHAYDAESVNGSYVLAMEYVEGADLGKIVKEGGPLPVREACDYVRQAALGLQHASEKGLVHRDIKPSNLILTQAPGAQPPGVVKVLDLGLALLQQPLVDTSTSGPLTVAGKVVGTVDYIAPEQARNASGVDIRADIYGLGCTFYYLLTGKPPFEGATITNKLFKHALEEPPPVEKLRPEVPPPVAALLRKMMAKSPDDRYQTPAELAAALDDVLHGRPAKAVPVEPGRTKAVAVPVAALPLRQPKAPNRRWLWLSLVGLGVFLVLSALLVSILHRLTAAPDRGKEETQLPAAEREAQAHLDRLRQRQQDAGADWKQLREELLAFRWRYPGLPQTQQALALLRDFPSPLDDLDPAKIPPRRRFDRQPPELVAVLFNRTEVLQTTPDGPRVLRAHGAALSYDDLTTGLPVHDFKGAGGPISAMGLSLDGKYALLGGKNKYLGLWDVTTGHEVRPLAGHAGDVRAAALSPDGRWGLSGGDDKAVYLWDLGDGTRYALGGHTAAVTGVAFTPDGKLALSTGADRTLRLWDLEIRRERKPVVEAPAPVSCLALAPDGKRAYTGGPKGVLRWSVSPPAADGSLDGYAESVSSLALSADGRYLAAGHTSGFVGVWDLPSGELVKKWKLPAAAGLSWAFDGRHLLVAGDNHGIFVLRMSQ